MKLSKEELNKFLSKDKEVIERLVKIHEYLEPKFDIFESKDGKTGSYIVLVRSLSLLLVSNDLLKTGNASEAQVYYRTIHEANALSLYFIFSYIQNKNKRQINAWFNKSKNLDLKGIRKFLSDISDIPPKYLNRLFGDYSKLLHHTYYSIMESYSYFANFSPLKAKEKKAGFTYHQAPFFGKNVYDYYLEFVHQYQNLIQLTLMAFYIAFHKAQNLLNQDEIQFIEREINYYNSPLKNKLKVLKTT